MKKLIEVTTVTLVEVDIDDSDLNNRIEQFPSDGFVVEKAEDLFMYVASRIADDPDLNYIEEIGYLNESFSACIFDTTTTIGEVVE